MPTYTFPVLVKSIVVNTGTVTITAPNPTAARKLLDAKSLLYDIEWDEQLSKDVLSITPDLVKPIIEEE